MQLMKVIKSGIMKEVVKMLKKLIAMVLVAMMTMSLGSGALAAESVSYGTIF